MGMKKLVAGAVAVCGIMAVHSPAWALAVHTMPVPIEHRLPDGTPMTAEQIALVNQLGMTPDQVAAVQEMLVAVHAQPNKPLTKIESWTWALSVVPGLGQFVMGDQMGGIFWFLGANAPWVISNILGSIFWGLGAATATTGLWAVAWPIWTVISLVLGLASLGIWLLNLWDAYKMNQELLGRSAEIQITPDLRARRKDGDVALNYTFGRF
jgi:hypothetical protein